VLSGDGRFASLNKTSEVIHALISLGYNRLEADKMVRNVSVSDAFSGMSVEDIIREVLKGK
jgi:Holliday junction resolvasome RuvABC DNA-binding subunit